MIVPVVFAREMVDAHLVEAVSYPLRRRLHDSWPGLVRRRANGAAEGNPGRDDGVRVASAEFGQRGAVVKASGIEKIGTDAARLQREIAKAEIRLVESQLEKPVFVILHRRIPS